MADNKSLSMVASFMIMIGGLLGIGAVFLTWMDFIGILQYSGWELFRLTIDSGSASSIGSDYPGYMPLVVLIFSAIGLLSGIISIAKPNKVSGAGAIVCGILVLIAVIVFWTYSESGISMSDFVGIGVYLAAAAGVILIIFGALRR